MALTKEDLNDALKAQTTEIKKYVKKEIKREVKSGVDSGVNVLRVLIEANGAKMDQLIEGYKPNVDQIRDNRTSIENLTPRVETLEDSSKYLIKKIKAKDV